jgi:ParB-like chromosome segregation protein Spo0J
MMSDFWNRRGFLKSVAALTAAFPSAVKARENEVVWLPLQQLKPGFHKHPGLEKLSEDIKANGIINPLLCVREGNYYRIVDGDCRWNVAVSLGHKMVPCKILT